MKITSAKLKQTRELPEASIWLVAGEDSRLRRGVTERLEKSYLDEGFAGFDCEVMEGSGLLANRALSAWQTLPLASQRRVVIVRNLQDMSSAELQKIAAATQTPAPRGLLVLESETDTGKDMQALIKAVDSGGVVVTCGALKPEEAKASLLEYAAAKGLQMDGMAAEEMVHRLGPDVWQLETELEKLASYIWPETRLRKGDVDALIPAPPEDRIFAMVDALCEGNARTARELMDGVFLAADDDRATAHRTLAVLARHFRLLWQARLLRETGFSFRDAKAEPGVDAARWLPEQPNIMEVFKRQAFLMGKYRNQSERFTLGRIARVMEILAETDLALKGYATSMGKPRADMEMLVLKLATLARGTKQRPALKR